jgi:meso-butanediol dehydrogenase / (S,S)-butanediol dehydrogenase / diacetyl reductase
MTRRLAGRVAVVTGAASGQGAAVAARFAAEGADLVLADIREEGLDQTRKAIEETGRAALAVPTDLTRETDLRALAAAAGEAFGKVDVLYNNAGVISGGDVDGIDWDAFDRVLAVNAKSQLFLVKHALPYLKAAGKASIVNVSSVGGLVGAPHNTVYAASKAAVSGITRCLAVELEPFGVRVNCIAPGAVDTPMPGVFLAHFEGAELERMKGLLVSRQIQKRWATADEIASVAAFLASDDSSYITGHILPVDGGYLAQ